jgi:hypothetical protein
MASTYLSRTVGTATNNKKATFSFWIKRGTVTNRQMFVRIINPSSTAAYSYIEFDGTADTLTYDDFDGSSTRITRSTSQVFRDVSAWYHIVIAVDTTQATGSDRAKVYVNGEQVTSFASTSDATQDYVLTGQTNGKTFYIGAAGDVPSFYFDGSMAHFHFIDGTAYDADTFGETDATTGIWKPKTAPSVTYGTNGFFLKFASAGSLGTDSSGNGNNFTLSGSGTQTQDTPANVFATFNPLDKGYTGTIVLSNGNTTTEVSSGAGDYGLRSTLGVSSGKYYWECKIASGNTLSVGDMDARLVFSMNDNSPTADFYGVQRYSDSATNMYDDGSFVSQNTAMWGGFTSSDIISFAVDLDNGKIFLAKNGTYKDQSGNTGDPAAGTNPTFTISDTTKTYGFYTELRANDADGTQINFGNGYFGTTAVSSAQSPSDGIGLFEYSVPSGYKALCTKSINAQEYS